MRVPLLSNTSEAAVPLLARAPQRLESVGSAVSPFSGGRNLDLPRGRNAGGEVDRGRDDGLLFRKGSLS